MKRSINLFCLLLLTPVLTMSCGTNSKSVAETSNTTSANNCFERYYGQPRELLTLELLKEFIDFGASTPQISVPPVMRSQTDYATANCRWKTNNERYTIRLQKIMKLDLDGKTPTERFFQKYHTLSDEEIARAKEALNKELDKKEAGADAGGLLKATDMKIEFDKIAGIGDAAVWEAKANNLIVLVGEYQFTVNVDLKDEPKERLAKARLIARAIIKKACG